MLLEWAYMRGVDYSAKEARIIARAHLEVWFWQGVAAEPFHLHRGRELYEVVLKVPELAQDPAVWIG